MTEDKPRQERRGERDIPFTVAGQGGTATLREITDRDDAQPQRPRRSSDGQKER